MKKIKPKVKLSGGLLCNKCNKVIRPVHSEAEAEGKSGPVLCNACLDKLVYGYKTKYKEGFTCLEYRNLMMGFPTLNKDKFYDALKGITCMSIDGQTIIYPCDILLALQCGLENRNPKTYEWD